ncbi:MAG: Lrp/AsnC family transcriptional regulator [Desulfurococcales archaeon]|nr:Lrp/AsnC family transcriptional regulator [Desulfurococcales archaeon]
MGKKPSNNGLKVDERDLQLLGILEKDSRTPWTRVAKEMGVSEATVYLRVKKLEEKGVLEGFSIIVNPSRLGLGVTLIVMLRVRAHYINKVKSSLSMNRYVVELYETTGYYNLLAKILAPSLSDINEIIDEIYSLKGVEEVEHIVALREVKRVKRIVNEVIFSNQ